MTQPCSAQVAVYNMQTSACKVTGLPEAVLGIVVGCKLLGGGDVQQCSDGMHSVTGSLLAPRPHHLKAPVHA